MVNVLIMYCIFARESVKKMNGNRGKLASMAGHAYLHSYWDAESRFVHRVGYDNEYFLSYRDGPALKYKHSGFAKKVTLIVDTVDELVAFKLQYEKICGVSLVTDSALTVFDEPTTVCLGIGPISEKLIGDDIKNLKVFI